MGAEEPGAGSRPPGPRDRFVYKHCPAWWRRRRSPGGAGPWFGAGDPLARSPASLGTGRPSLCFLVSVVPEDLNANGSGRVGASDVFCPRVTLRVLWRPLGRGRRPGGLAVLETLGSASPALSRGNRSEFLPGRFPAPPHGACQRVGASSPAQRNVGASAAGISQGLALRGSPDPSLLQVLTAWPLTSSGCFSSNGGLFLLSGAGEGDAIWFLDLLSWGLPSLTSLLATRVKSASSVFI